MPIKNFYLKISFLLLCGLVLDYGVSYLKNSPARKLAPMQEKGLLPAPKLDLWGHSAHGKMNQNMDVVIEAVGGIPDNDEQELRLSAQVTLNRPVDQELSYRWILPLGAVVISGQVEDSWPGIKPGETATAEIYLAGVSKEGLAKTVTLQVFATSSISGQPVKYANSGSFTTDPRSLTFENEELALKMKAEVGKIKE